MGNIPTVAFDAGKHVLVCRNSNDGVEAYVTLESVVAAEQPYEMPRHVSHLSSLFDIFNRAKEVPMNREAFEALDEAGKVAALAEGLAALRTAIPDGPDMTPIEQSLAEIKAALATIASDGQKSMARITAIETAIFSAGGKA
jgi:hypothetical protein